MTDHEKLLCALLCETEDQAREGVPQTTSPLRVVSILLGRPDFDRAATA